MFYALSKIFVVFFYPLSWIFLLLLVAVITKVPHRRKRILIAAVVLLFLFSNTFLLNAFAKAWDIRTMPPTIGKPYSCGIVLGGFASEDDRGEGYFNGSSDRFIEAAKLKTTNRVAKILISSGAAFLTEYKWNEADYVATQFKALNFADSAVLVENKSRNTLENAAFSKKVLLAHHLAPPYLLITSAFHMRRALYTFKKTGLDVVPYPCDFIAGKEKGSFLDALIPSASTLYNWNLYTKEVIGLVTYSLKLNKGR
jgi:uncharacterized SAM-binding protein YcdF (DUF218 family)